MLFRGTWNPAVVRTDWKMLTFIRAAAEKGLPIFAIYHGPDPDQRQTCHRTEDHGFAGRPRRLRNAGADVVEDQAVVVDEGANGVSLLCQVEIQTIWRHSAERS